MAEEQLTILLGGQTLGRKLDIVGSGAFAAAQYKQFGRVG
jgi:hypothetical protein